jgi:P27 family predicted phage terminase small subunit
MMPKGGTNATPIALRVLNGNPGKRPIPKTPTPPVQTPVEPDWAALVGGVEHEDVIRLAETASAEWNRVVPVLDQLGLLTALDAPVLTDYALCWARLVQCERALAADGLILETWLLDADGKRVRSTLARNPVSVSAKEYRGQLRAYVAEFGLGPASRSRIHLQGDAADREDSSLYDTP